MAEYMDYNDVPDYKYKSKGQKYRAMIALTLSIVFIIGMVVWVCVRSPKNTRSDFESVTGSIHTVGEYSNIEKNEFYALSQVIDNQMPIDVDEKRYPALHKLINMSRDDIAADKVISFDENGALTLAKVYIISQDADSDGNPITTSDGKPVGELGVDVVVLPYSANDGITVGAPIKYSLKYQREMAQSKQTVQSNFVYSDRFRLNFYSVKINLKSKSGIASVTSKMTLTDALTKEEEKKQQFSKYMSIEGVENISTTLISGESVGDFNLTYGYSIPTPYDELVFKLDFNDSMYNKFSSVTLGVPSDCEYSITVN